MKLHSLFAGVLLMGSAGMAQAVLLPNGWGYFDFRVDFADTSLGSITGSFQASVDTGLDGITQSMHGQGAAQWFLTGSPYTATPYAWAAIFPWMAFTDGVPSGGGLIFRALDANNPPLLHELSLSATGGSLSVGDFYAPQDPHIKTVDYFAGGPGAVSITPQMQFPGPNNSVPDGGSTLLLLAASCGVMARCLRSR